MMARLLECCWPPWEVASYDKSFVCEWLQLIAVCLILMVTGGDELPPF